MRREMRFMSRGWRTGSVIPPSVTFYSHPSLNRTKTNLRVITFVTVEFIRGQRREHLPVAQARHAIPRAGHQLGECGVGQHEPAVDVPWCS